MSETEVKIDADDVFDNTPVPTLITNLKTGMIIKANKAFVEVFQKSGEEVVGKTVRDINLWQDFEQRKRIVKKLEKYGRTSCEEVALNDKYGNTRHMLLSGSVLNKNPDLLISVATDITFLKTQEVQYRNLYEKYRDLIDITKTAYVILDNNLLIQECNSIFTDMLECEENSVIGDRIDKYLISADNIIKEEIIFSVIQLFKLERKNIRNMRICLCTTDQKQKYIWVNMNANNYGENKVVCFMYDIRDIKIEEEKKHIISEKRKDKLKQNLNSIRKYLNNLNGNNK